MQRAPAVDVDGEEFVVVDAPVLALTDELSEYRERNVLRRDGHLLATIALEVVPLAVVLGRKPTLRYRRRQQIWTHTRRQRRATKKPETCFLLMNKRQRNPCSDCKSVR